MKGFPVNQWVLQHDHNTAVTDTVALEEFTQYIYIEETQLFSLQMTYIVFFFAKNQTFIFIMQLSVIEEVFRSFSSVKVQTQHCEMTKLFK